VQGRQDHPIGGIPAHALDLALQNLRLATKRRYLGLKLCLVVAPGHHHVKEDADQRIQKRGDHPDSKSYPARVIARSVHRPCTPANEFDVIVEPHTPEGPLRIFCARQRSLGTKQASGLGRRCRRRGIFVT